MKNDKGFVGLGLILAIIAVLVIGGGAYYLGTKNNSVPQNIEVNNNQPVENQNQNNSPKLEVPTGPFLDKTNYVPPKPISCNSNTTPWIQVLSPNGGEVYVVGQKINIRWDSRCISSNDKILIGIVKIVSNQEVAFEDIHEINTTNTGSYGWVIPKNINTGQYEVEIKFLYGNGDAAYDKSDNLFTIK